MNLPDGTRLVSWPCFAVAFGFLDTPWGLLMLSRTVPVFAHYTQLRHERVSTRHRKTKMPPIVMHTYLNPDLLLCNNSWLPLDEQDQPLRPASCSTSSSIYPTQKLTSGTLCTARSERDSNCCLQENAVSVSWGLCLPSQSSHVSMVFSVGVEVWIISYII